MADSHITLRHAHFLAPPSARKHFIYGTKIIGSARSAGEKDTLLCSTGTVETGVMSLSETACTGHVRATRVMPRRKGGGSASCSVLCACNEVEWLEGEKEEEEKLEGAESDISCFSLCASLVLWDKMCSATLSACISGRGVHMA